MRAIDFVYNLLLQITTISDKFSLPCFVSVHSYVVLHVLLLHYS